MKSRTFSEKLKHYREKNELTQQQVADKLNIHRTTYTYYEKGRTEPSIKLLSKIIEIFNISYYDLLPDYRQQKTIK